MNRDQYAVKTSTATAPQIEKSYTWYVSYDKLRSEEPVYLNRQHCGELKDALEFKRQMESKGYRTKVWWDFK